ncbi:hypothetical protein FJTKL_03731 [Diaporthe vaccinii]|uniref:Uncharacterized protein n=1 Tax=Diaporthe vaccinii TaxID=105482 RepID=A0ABR4DUH0_9PEZI
MDAPVHMHTVGKGIVKYWLSVNRARDAIDKPNNRALLMLSRRIRKPVEICCRSSPSVWALVAKHVPPCHRLGSSSRASHQCLSPGKHL